MDAKPKFGWYLTFNKYSVGGGPHSSYELAMMSALTRVQEEMVHEPLRRLWLLVGEYETFDAANLLDEEDIQTLIEDEACSPVHILDLIQTRALDDFENIDPKEIAWKVSHDEVAMLIHQALGSALTPPVRGVLDIVRGFIACNRFEYLPATSEVMDIQRDV